ncbi:hypothetical protein FIM12_05350 [SAR202 cluster bacterium AD-804-J14_MRT_500m]|nr:hypothetical protein [SAR202 cluster bacterium AD-804-J14_MRT_500m]
MSDDSQTTYLSITLPTSRLSMESTGGLNPAKTTKSAYILKLPIVPTALLLLSVIVGLTCGNPKHDVPAIDIFTSTAQQNISAVQHHMSAGTNPNQWILKGFEWAALHHYTWQF